jgi:hypothetical protein
MARSTSRHGIYMPSLWIGLVVVLMIMLGVAGMAGGAETGSILQRGSKANATMPSDGTVQGLLPVRSELRNYDGDAAVDVGDLRVEREEHQAEYSGEWQRNA